MTTAPWPCAEKRYTMYRFSSEIRDAIKRLNKSDNWHSLLFFAIDLFWIGACVVACHWVSWWLYPIAVLIVGARQRAFSTIFHDCIHGMGAQNRILNMVLGTVLTAYPIFQQYYAYRLSHVFRHHPKLGDPEGDPDLAYFIKERIYEPIALRRYFNRVVLLPILGSRTISFLGYLVSNRFRIRSKRDSALLDKAQISRTKQVLDKAGFWAFWGLVALIGWRTGTLLDIALFWIVPYLTGFQLLSWYIELAEHTPLVRFQNVDIYLTRNRKSRGLEKFFTGIHNDHYHLDHHLDVRTPCWNLPKAHAIRMRDESFRKVDEETGGLFIRGPEGQPSVISIIVNTLSIQEARRETARPA